MIQLSKRTVIFALVAFTVVAGLATASFVRTLAPADAANFKDTPPWAAKQINWLADNGIARGYNDNTFRPDLNITRAQAAFWFGNYNSTISTHQDQTTATNIVGVFRDVYCPSGKRAVAGGATSDSVRMHLYNSGPTANGLGWQAGWRSDDDTTVGFASFTVTVTCVPSNAGS